MDAQKALSALKEMYEFLQAENMRLTSENEKLQAQLENKSLRDVKSHVYHVTSTCPDCEARNRLFVGFRGTMRGEIFHSSDEDAVKRSLIKEERIEFGKQATAVPDSLPEDVR